MATIDPGDETEETSHSSDVPPMIDFLLRALVDLANKTGMEIGMTLSVGGVLVSGNLASGKTYFKEIAAETLQATGDAKDSGINQSLSDYFANWGKLIYEQPENEDQSNDEAMSQPNYIHLRNAKFVHNSGKSMPSNRGIWWRGRLSAIDGFSLGIISSD